MPLAKFVVQVHAEQCPICDHTEQRPATRLLIEPVTYDDRHPMKMHVTVLGDPDQQDRFMAAMEEASGNARYLRREDDLASVLVEDPADGTISGVYGELASVTGPGATFEPALMADGWMTLPFVSVTNGEPAGEVETYKARLQEEGFEFRLVHFRRYDPDEAMSPTEDLTDKQLEVVRVAYSMGYYETPRGCTLSDLGEMFGISKAAVHMRLRTAERKIVSQYL